MHSRTLMDDLHIAVMFSPQLSKVIEVTHEDQVLLVHQCVEGQGE